jgi:hypothetical protein
MRADDGTLGRCENLVVGGQQEGRHLPVQRDVFTGSRLRAVWCACWSRMPHAWAASLTPPVYPQAVPAEPSRRDSAVQGPLALGLGLDGGKRPRLLPAPRRRFALLSRPAQLVDATRAGGRAGSASSARKTPCPGRGSRPVCARSCALLLAPSLPSPPFLLSHMLMPLRNQAWGSMTEQGVCAWSWGRGWQAAGWPTTGSTSWPASTRCATPPPPSSKA